MAIVKGINRQIVLSKETTFGTQASGPGQLMRRVSTSLQLSKDIFASQEILGSQQVRDLRHGVRRATVSLDGQLSPGTYASVFEGLLRASFTAGVTMSAAGSPTTTSVAGPPGTFTRSSGSWLTDGFKVGDVVRFTGFTAGAAVNNSRNYRIKDLTATVLTVVGTGLETVVAASAASGVSCSVVGKKLVLPQTGQVFSSYSIESWMPDADTAISELYLGCRVQQISLSLPSTGLLTLSSQLVGQDMVTAATQVYASPTAATSSNSLAAVNGTVRFNGADVALITGAQMSIASTLDAGPVLGSNVVPDIFQGRLTVQGTMTVYVRDQAFYTLFSNETEVDLMFYLTGDGTLNSPFITLVMNRIKLTSASKNDGDRAIMQQVGFQALEQVSGGAGTKWDATTIAIQDSNA